MSSRFAGDGVGLGTVAGAEDPLSARFDAAAVAITRSSAVSSGAAEDASTVGAGADGGRVISVAGVAGCAVPGAAVARGAGVAAVPAGDALFVPAGGVVGLARLREIMYAPMRTPTMPTPILIAVSRRLVSGGGASGARRGGAVSVTPSTLLPQRHVMAGGATRRPQSGHTRLSVDEAAPAIYGKILT